MADINIVGLNDAGPISTADLLHISQGGVDYKVTIANLSSEFGKADVWGQIQDGNPAGNDVVLTSSSSDINDNRKVDLSDIIELSQTPTYYPTVATIGLADEVVFRVDSDAGLSETSMQAMRDTVINLEDGFANIITTGWANTDRLLVRDVSANEDKFTTLGGLRGELFDKTNFSTITDNNNVDWVYVIEGSTPRKISYANFIDNINSGAGDVFLAGTQTFTGLKKFQAGLQSNSITPLTGTVVAFGSGNEITVGNVSATTVSATTAFTGAPFRGSEGTNSKYLDVQNDGTGLVTVNRTGAIIPADSATGTKIYATLGVDGMEWAKGYFDDVVVKDDLFLTNNLYKGGSSTAHAIFDGSDKIKETFLPDILKKGTNEEFQMGVGVNAFIGNQLSAAFKHGTGDGGNNNLRSLYYQDPINSWTGIHGSKSGQMKRHGSFKIGGMVVNFGEIYIKNNTGGNTVYGGNCKFKIGLGAGNGNGNYGKLRPFKLGTYALGGAVTHVVTVYETRQCEGQIINTEHATGWKELRIGAAGNTEGISFVVFGEGDYE